MTKLKQNQFRLNLTRSNQSVQFVVMAVAMTIALLMTTNTFANAVLADNYPERYTVVEGDTLWDISGKFLRDPWRWPEVWQGNPQVDNPDLIYPGDVLVMTFLDGKPVLRSLRRETIKLSPKARIAGYRDAIAPIDPAAIEAYINSPLVTDAKELNESGYIVEGLGNRLILGKYDQFYARAVRDEDALEYRVFRPGRHFVDPVSKESLGWEAVHVGDANLLKVGDPARMSLLKTYQDVSIRDRLRPVFKKEALPFFSPKAPNNDRLRGVILQTPNRSTELGSLSVVAINLGEREDVHPGDVFRINSQRMKRKDPITKKTYFIPEEKVGLMLVFRTFEKVSYALVTDSSRSIRPGDVVTSPNESSALPIGADIFGDAEAQVE